MYIEARNIYKAYDKHTVFENFDFFARKGDSVCISGPNGSGKSTLLKLLAGRNVPDLGTVKIDGIAAETYRKAVLLPQNYRLAEHKTLLENLSVPLKLRGFSRKDASAVASEQLKTFGLKNFTDYYPCQLSDGVIRRAAIAEVGLFDADLLLLDEPFGGIDRDSIKDIYLYLTAKRLEGVTLILVTHSSEEADILTERTVYLENLNAA